MANTLKPIGVSNSKKVFTDMKGNARVRGLKFNINYEQFLLLTSQNCFYCDSKLKQCHKAESVKKRFNGLYYYNGLDRVDNDKNYELDNVVPCCMTCNRAKNKMSITDFKKWVKQIYLKLCW